MKLNEIYNDEWDHLDAKDDARSDFYSDMAEQQMLDMVEDYLFSGNHKPKVNQAIDSLDAQQLKELKDILRPSAEENYDYSTDFGPEITIPEDHIVHALRLVGAM